MPVVTEQDLETFEEGLSELLFRLGPPLAINDPKARTKNTDVGAARLQASNEWQALVESLFQRARYIVVMIDNSPGVRWEIAKAFTASGRVRVFIMPPVQGFGERRKFRKDYTELRQQFDGLPPYDPQLVALLYSPRGRKPQTFRSTRPDPSPRERLLIIESVVLSILNTQPSKDAEHMIPARRT